MIRRAGRWAAAGALAMTVPACRDEATTASATTPTTLAETTIAAVTTAAPTTPAATATSTTATTTATTPAPAMATYADDPGAIAAIAATFTGSGSPISEEDAHCIGDGLVHVFGRQRAQQLGFGRRSWSSLVAPSARDPWDTADSTAIVDTFRVCTTDWEVLVIPTVRGGAEPISTDSARCVADALPDDTSRLLFIELLTSPGADAAARLQPALQGCLTPAELAAGMRPTNG